MIVELRCTGEKQKQSKMISSSKNCDQEEEGKHWGGREEFWDCGVGVGTSQDWAVMGIFRLRNSQQYMARHGKVWRKSTPNRGKSKVKGL